MNENQETLNLYSQVWIDEKDVKLNYEKINWKENTNEKVFCYGYYPRDSKGFLHDHSGHGSYLGLR